MAPTLRLQYIVCENSSLSVFAVFVVLWIVFKNNQHNKIPEQLQIVFFV